jgi:hypothetical protein
VIEGPKLPPRLGKDVSRLDHYGKPRPEWEIKSSAVRRADPKEWAKRFARDSHWSVRRKLYDRPQDGFLVALIELIGLDETRTILRGMRFYGWRFAASQTLQRFRARKVLTAKFGRPSTPEQRLVAMMVSVEAYIGSGLRREQALERAGKNWGTSKNWVNSFGTLGDIYKKQAKLPDDSSKLLRAFFRGIKAEEVDRFIERFLELEAGGE